ncbi:MAG TPA: hypothetical protein DEB06_05085, partial [Phycisphaerales bacterium]|nr:hypothetical protein [Phycisphaerales bacterium]
MAPAPGARAQVLKDSLPELEGVGIVDRKGAEIPRGLVFTDDAGRSVTSDEWFDGERPVLLVLAYYDCPLLCTLTLNSVQRALNEMDWTTGVQYRVVTVSFDSRNSTEDAREKRELYLAGYAREAPADGWRFHTGSVEQIKALTNAVGFHYRFLAESGEFSHPSAAFFLSPDGRLHNFIEQLKFDPKEVRLALMEAADGRAGSIFDRIAHRCFPYDPRTGRHSARATGVMQVGVAAASVGVAGFVAYSVLSKRGGSGAGGMG